MRTKTLEYLRPPGAANDLPGPACVLDVAAGRLLWANAKGAKLLGYDVSGSCNDRFANGLALDRAMPAFGRLAAIRDALLAGETRAETLVFWTDDGPRTLTCSVHCPDADQQPDVVLLQASVPPRSQKRQLIAETLPSIFPRRRNGAQPKPAQPPVAADADTMSVSDAILGPAVGRDLDALQQIAQQIRQQRSADPKPAAPQQKTNAPTAVPTREPASAAELESIADPPTSPVRKSNGLSERFDATRAELGHELRTPLGAISGFADMMAAEHFGPLGHEKYAGYVRDIQASAAHVLSLVDEFTTAKGDEVAQKLSFSDVDVNQVADECLSAMRPMAEQAGVRLAGALAVRLPRIIADRRTLKQIFLNLLANAIRFNAAGGTATLTTSYAPGGVFSVEVSDTGIGMSRETIARATGQDGTADGVLPGNGGRQGRGLQLTARLVAANGAQLAIESTPGEGTTVAITVPADRLVLV